MNATVPAPLTRAQQAILNIALEQEHGITFRDLGVDALFFCLAPDFTTETLRKTDRALNGTNAVALDGAFRAVIPDDWLVVPEEARSRFTH